jgi:nicotinamide-nucleotide amidase
MIGLSAIVSVGDELLSGRVLDTNASWLSSVLRVEGFPTAARFAVRDDVDAIAAAVRQAEAEGQIVVVGGGIGPTKDDLTRDGVAAALGVPLTLHDGALDLVRSNYSRRGMRVPEGSEVQAMLPAGAEPIQNGVGTAPGILVRRAAGTRVLAVLPGVPAEFRAMVERSLIPILRVHPDRGSPPVLASLTVAGLREVDAGNTIADLMERGRDPLVGSYPKLGRIVLTVESAARPEAEAARRVGETVAEIRRRLGAAVVGEGDLRLNEVVAALLLERGVTVATAESLTGGLVSDGFVEVPGISRVFIAGFVTYSNRAKIDLLGVPDSLVLARGAASEECARAMAEGARARTGADLALSVTGVAGPDGGSEEKPVGTVWFALSDAAGTAAARVRFPGDRAAVRAFARERAFEIIRRRLLGLPPL